MDQMMERIIIHTEGLTKCYGEKTACFGAEPGYPQG